MTIRLDERDYAALKGEAAREAPGHWRCVYRNIFGFKRDTAPDGGLWLGDEWVAKTRYLTEAEADCDGRKFEAIAKRSIVFAGLRYVRAEFFPDYSGGGA